MDYVRHYLCLQEKPQPDSQDNILITRKHKNVSIDHVKGIGAIEEENAQGYYIVCQRGKGREYFYL